MVLCCCQSAVGGEGGHTFGSDSGTLQLSKHADTLLHGKTVLLYCTVLYILVHSDTLLHGKNEKLRSASTEWLHNTMKHAASTKGSPSVLKRLIAAVCINPDYRDTHWC